MTAPSPEQQFLTLRQVAEMLGCSERTLRRWRRDGRLKTSRIAGTVRIRMSDLEVALAGFEAPANVRQGLPAGEDPG